jgi:hypothetical protein
MDGRGSRGTVSKSLKFSHEGRYCRHQNGPTDRVVCCQYAVGLCFAAYSYLGESQLNRVAIIAPDFCDRTSQTVRSWDTLARAVEDLELWPQRQAPARADFREQRQGVRALPFLAQCHTLSPNTPSETDPINSRLYRLRHQSRMRPTLTSYTANGGGHRLPKGPSGLSVRPTDPYFQGTHPRPTAPRARQPLW